MVNSYIQTNFQSKIIHNKDLVELDEDWLTKTFGEQFLSLTPLPNNKNIFPVLNETAKWVDWCGWFYFKIPNDMMFFKLARR
jgi:hypothetical protein